MSDLNKDELIKNIYKQLMNTEDDDITEDDDLLIKTIRESTAKIQESLLVSTLLSTLLSKRELYFVTPKNVKSVYEIAKHILSDEDTHVDDNISLENLIFSLPFEKDQ